MKRLFHFFFTLLTSIIGLQAETVTDILNSKCFTATSTTYKDFSGVQVTSDAVYAGQTAAGNNSIQMRSNNSNSGIITTTSGGKIRSITVTWHTATNSARKIDVYGKSSAYTSASDLYNTSNQGTKIGSISYSESPETLTISDDYEYIGIRSNSGALYASEIQIVWETEAAGTRIAKPTFSSTENNFIKPFDLTLSCETANAKIFYTLDGTDPTTSSSEYTAPITISETTTVKAIAASKGQTSDVATQTYTKLTLLSISEAKELYDATGSNVTIALDLTGTKVTVNEGQYLFIEDETAGINIYNSGAQYPAGSKFTGGYIQGTSSCYNGLHQVTGASFVDVTTESVEITPVEVSISDLLSQYETYEARYVKLSEVFIQGTTISDSQKNTLASYDRFSLGYADVYTESTECDIIGVVSKYNTTIQLLPTEFVTYEKVSVTFDINGQTSSIQISLGDYLEESQLPTVSLPADLALAGWSLQKDCSSRSELVSLPLALNEDKTLYAVYSYSGTQDFNLVTDVTDLSEGDNVIIVADEYDYALSTTQESNYRGRTEIQGAGSAVIPNSAVTNEVQILTLEKSGTAFAFNTGSGYLCSPSKSNYLRTTETLDEKSLWNITIEEGITQINNTGNTDYYIMYNSISGQERFSCYKGTQKNVALYKGAPQVYSTRYLTANVPDDLGYITFCHSENVIIPTGIQAYAATGANNDNSYISLQEFSGVIPAGEGCLIGAPMGTYSLLIGGEAATPANNYMVGYCGDAAYETVTVDDQSVCYILTVVDNVLVFGKKETDFKVYQGKAYLRLPGAIAANTLSIHLGTNGIQSVGIENKPQTSGIYNLSGQQIQEIITPGIYIIDGKKVWIR